jgi:nucleotide-binding universal stress UspA family protein
MLEREFDASGVVAELTGMASPTVGRGLHQLAQDHRPDLLVVGSCRRRSVGRLLRGDDTRGSLSGAACAVAIAPHGYAERSREITTIGVADNDTPGAEAALAAARGLSARLRASVQAVTVVSLAAAGPGAWGALDVGWGGGIEGIEGIEQAARDRLRSLDGVDGRVAVGLPSDELVAFGDEVELLVVGSRSFGPLRRLILGSTSMHLACDVRSPLLVLPRAAVVVSHERDES